MQVANAPCSWGVLELAAGDSAGYEQVLDEIAASGFSGSELGDWGFMPTEPDALAAALAARELALVGAFVPVALADPAAHDAGVASALRTAQLVAAVAPDAFIVLADDNGTVSARVENAGRVQPEHGLDDAAWRTFAAGAERVARAVRDATGLRTVFHPHGAGFVETPAEVARLLDLTDDQLLGLCLDSGHAALGGGDALSLLERAGERVWHVHFKDFSGALAERARAERWDYFAQVRAGIFCELGQGDVDFAALLAALRQRGYDEWIVVEQDVLPGMGTPLDSARRNRAFLADLGL